MTNSVNDTMLMIYCFVDEFLQTHPVVAQWRHSPRAQPRFSDAEVLTIALLQGVLEVATLKQTYRLVVQNWRAAFPHLPSDKQGLARVHPLQPQVGQLLAATCGHAPSAARLYLIDSKPIPLCAPPSDTGGCDCCAIRARILAKPARGGSLASSCICCATLVDGCSISS
jgi:hypothetical protein